MSSSRFSPFWPFKKKAPKPPRYRRHREEHHRDRYDWITLWTAIAGVVIVAVSTGITAWQAYLTRQELNALIAQDRAWLRLDINLQTDLIVSGEGAFLLAQVKATNVGTMPAYKAWGYSRLYVVPTEDESLMLSSPAEEVCLDQQRYGTGASIFPGETLPLIGYPTMPDRTEVDAQEGTAGTVGFLLLACVQYETADQPVLRQTGALYLVGKKNSRGEYSTRFNSTRDRIKREEIQLTRMGIGDVTN